MDPQPNHLPYEPDHHFYAADDSPSDPSLHAAAAAAASAGDEDDDYEPKDVEETMQPQQAMDESSALREMHEKIAAASASRNSSSAAVTQEEKVEVDSRSIYVGNVDYACTPEEVQHHFQSCGTINRITILTDKFGQPKGFAYVEFVENDAVQNALLLNESELHGRQLKVCAKRTNIPGMKQLRGGRPGFRSRSRYFPPGGFGKAPRFRRPPPGFRPYF